MSFEPTSLPSGISRPSAEINEHDQSGIIAILAAFSLAMVLLSSGVHVYTKRYSGRYRFDDAAFFAAVAFAIIQLSLVLYEVSIGLGQEWSSLNTFQLVSMHKTSYATDVCYIIVLFWSKAACALFLHWLTPYQRHRVLTVILLAFDFMWVLSSCLVEGLRCVGIDEIDHLFRCDDSFRRWIYIGVIDMLLEVGLITTSCYLVWDLKVVPRQKFIVFGAFTCRIPNIALTITRLVFLSDALTFTDWGAWEARVTSVTVLAVSYTIIACIIPYLRPFIQAHESGKDGRSNTSYKFSDQSSRGGPQVSPEESSRRVSKETVHDEQHNKGPSKPGGLKFLSRTVQEEGDKVNMAERHGFGIRKTIDTRMDFECQSEK